MGYRQVCLLEGEGARRGGGGEGARRAAENYNCNPQIIYSYNILNNINVRMCN
jgi:hypothetical protein